MRVDTKGHTTIIKNKSKTLQEIVNFVFVQKHQFLSKNVIIDLSILENVLPKEIQLFNDFYKELKQNKKSLVLVLNDFDFNANTKKINVAPSLLEAHDIIELDEIERDLGF